MLAGVGSLESLLSSGERALAGAVQIRWGTSAGRHAGSLFIPTDVAIWKSILQHGLFVGIDVRFADMQFPQLGQAQQRGRVADRIILHIEVPQLCQIRQGSSIVYLISGQIQMPDLAETGQAVDGGDPIFGQIEVDQFRQVGQGGDAIHLRSTDFEVRQAGQSS